MTTRVVLDTNVLASAVGWSGPSARILDAALEGRLELIMSPALVGELRRVLAYPRLAKAIGDPAGIIELIEAAAVVVAPERPLAVVRDPDDNRVLETALAGGADYVVSGDKDLRDLGSFQSIPILSPAAFLAEILGAERE